MDLFDTLTFAEILRWTTFLDTLSLTVLNYKILDVCTKYYTEYNIYCGFINTMGLYIRLSYFHPFQQSFIHFDKFHSFFIHYSSKLPTLNNVEKIVWPTVYAVFGVVDFVAFCCKTSNFLEYYKIRKLIFKN
jgi:hypothetical protein